MHRGQHKKERPSAAFFVVLATARRQALERHVRFSAIRKTHAASALNREEIAVYVMVERQSRAQALPFRRGWLRRGIDLRLHPTSQLRYLLGRTGDDQKIAWKDDRGGRGLLEILIGVLDPHDCHADVLENAGIAKRTVVDG